MRAMLMALGHSVRRSMFHTLILTRLICLLVISLCLVTSHPVHAFNAHERALQSARVNLVRFPQFSHINDSDDSLFVGWRDHGLIPPEQPLVTPRPAGTLLLNMLVKDEVAHLERTLPLWVASGLLDAWIIGVDLHNNDASVAVIEKHLGHLPGHVVLVNFTGMGPTWSVLVKEGLWSYPHITHGLIADADFAPVFPAVKSSKPIFDKALLDVRCSKHMYTIRSEDGYSSRLMDWVYRNLRFVNVTRRTHQTLNAPELSNQEVFQTLLPLTLEEREGGYGDRSGNKDARYIQMLELDLIDYPADPRTLYYLAIAHLNMAIRLIDAPAPSSASSPIGVASSPHLQRALNYFIARSEVAKDSGNEEERWFALLKIAEIHERYLHDWARAIAFYDRAIALDAERADAFFYAGQRLRLLGRILPSLPYLKSAATLPLPQRSLFQWNFLYTCLAKLEWTESLISLTLEDLNNMLATKRSLLASQQVEQDEEDFRKSRKQRKKQLKKDFRLAMDALHQADCSSHLDNHRRRVELIERLKNKTSELGLNEKQKSVKDSHASPASPSSPAPSSLSSSLSSPITKASPVVAEPIDQSQQRFRQDLVSIAVDFSHSLDREFKMSLLSDEEAAQDNPFLAEGSSFLLDEGYSQWNNVFDQLLQLDRSASSSSPALISCRSFRRATAPWLKWLNDHDQLHTRVARTFSTSFASDYFTSSSSNSEHRHRSSGDMQWLERLKRECR